MRKFLAIAALAAALAACGGSSDDEDDDKDDKGGKSPSAEHSSSPLPDLFGPPAGGVGGSNDTMAAGKWSITTDVISGMGAGNQTTTETCVESDRAVSEMQTENLPPGVDCPVRDFQRTATGMTGKFQCTMQGVKMEMDMVISGDFKTRFTTDMTMKMDLSGVPEAAQSGMTSMTQTIMQTARRIGDC